MMNEAPATPELLTVDTIIRDYLSYQDTDLPPEVKERGLRDSLASESSRKYAEALKALFERDGIQSVRRLSQEMKDAMARETTRISIPVSPYGRSQTWALWDIAKQYYFFTHQGENDARYTIADPMQNRDKQREIVNRHIGWEARHAFTANSWPQFLTLEGREQAQELLQKPPKANNDLSSEDLADLGERLRVVRVAAPVEPQPVPRQEEQRQPEQRPPQRQERERQVPRAAAERKPQSVPTVAPKKAVEKTNSSSLPLFNGVPGVGTIAFAYSTITHLFDKLWEFGKLIFHDKKKKGPGFWSVLVSSLRHPMGSGSKPKAAPAADHGHGGHH